MHLAHHYTFTAIKQWFTGNLQRLKRINPIASKIMTFLDEPFLIDDAILSPLSLAMSIMRYLPE